jgi:hypothetical protein
LITEGSRAVMAEEEKSFCCCLDTSRPIPDDLGDNFGDKGGSLGVLPFPVVTIRISYALSHCKAKYT